MDIKFLRLLLGIMVMSLSGCAKKAPMERPNILWFISEDNSPYLGAYGDSLVNTPTLDAFAASGITFTNAFSNAPVCAPSRSGIITGVYPPALGSQHMRSNVEIAESIQFFPKYLKDAGYFTTLRLKRDYNIPNQEGTWDLDDWWNISDAFKSRAEGQPYFMMYNTWMTHEGKIHGRDSGPSYFRATFQELDTLKMEAMLSSVQSIGPDEVTVPTFMPDLPEVRDDLAYYYELMEMLDMEFKHVMDQLEASGELENTIIIYTSDHGGVLGRSKRFTFESGLHIPMIVKYPKKWQHLAPVQAGGKTDKVVSLIDIAPTVLELAGVQGPTHLMGKNILTSDDAELAFGFRGRMDESYDMVRTLRSKEFRYIRNYYPYRPTGQHVNYLWKAANVQAWEKAFYAGELDDAARQFFMPKPTEELYRISDDAGNIKNLVGNSNYNETLSEFRAALDSIMTSTKDTGVIPEGELWASTQNGFKTYQDYMNQVPFERIYQAANEATNGTDVQTLMTFAKDSIPSTRFWGTVGILVNLSRSMDTSELAMYESELKSLAEDTSGDVAANASEILYLMGFDEIAIQRLSELLLDENPYVALRASNAVEALSFKEFPLSIKNALEELTKKDEKGSHQYVIRKAKFFLGKRAY